MKFDFESLSTEPLFYMLMHSGVFVTVLGIIFFIIGLLFGYATWGRYKRQTRELRGEAAAMKDEIAQLKRKIGDQSVKSGPNIAMATETIHMPPKEGAPAAEAVPAITKETIPPQDARVPTKDRLPRSRANVIKSKTVTPAAPPAGPAVNEIKTPAPPPAEPITSSIKLPAPTEPPPPPARHSSPLAAIIATPPVVKEPEKAGDALPAVGLVPTDTIPTLTTELPLTPLPAVAIQPELDRRLGLIYKTRPEKIDDLTELKGIAKVLEQRLHEFGIYTYAQIAAWNEEHIKEFSARLAFKDRIQREQWVEQARQLAAKKA
ncbi:hypothetical protein [Prosthecobacter sp.]|uniref:hypothetical protein n=1 Tax=Prosthecobacter sp. TaxID=1965333 RepID=UPI002ABAFDED|nr:hypothetical protein [Prosthecobacter sp.]MDZ4403571.1 hypothetical protein [Prosthecobacter sp.]